MLIAEFMDIDVIVGLSNEGSIYYYHNNSESKDYEALPEYNNDWNELMPVIKKIKGLVCEAEFTHRIGCSLNDLNLEEVYNGCVKFIEWYNTKHKK